MDWQDIIVGIIMLLCAAWIARGFFGKSRAKDSGYSVCSSCPTPCDIKQLYDKKRDSCSSKLKKSSKSCCD